MRVRVCVCLCVCVCACARARVCVRARGGRGRGVTVSCARVHLRNDGDNAVLVHLELVVGVLTNVAPPLDELLTVASVLPVEVLEDLIEHLRDPRRATLSDAGPNVVVDHGLDGNGAVARRVTIGCDDEWQRFLSGAADGNLVLVHLVVAFT
jgi:hypothetical protein